MADAFDWGKESAPADEFDWGAIPEDFTEAPAEITTPAPRRKVPVVPSASVAALDAIASLNPGYQALRSIGWAGPGVRTEGDPEVGTLEHGLVNKPVSMLPAGNLLANLGATAATLGSRAVGSATPASALRRLASIPVVGQFAPAAGPGAALTPQARKELEAMGETVPKEPEAPGPVDTYRRLREARKQSLRAGAEQHPTADTAGAALGLGLGVLAPLPAFTPRGGEAAGLGARMLAGAGTGAAYGGLAGLTEGEADLTKGEVGQALAESGLGAAVGGALGGTLPAVGAGLRRLYQGVVRPTPEAQALQAQGVRGLTLGQMDPRSVFGVTESANQSVAGFGPMLQAQRGVAPESFRTAALNMVRPPGMAQIADDVPVPEAMAALQQGFDDLYRQIDATSAPTLAADRLLLRVSDPRQRILRRATTGQAEEAARFVQEQMTLLPAEGTQTSVGALRDMRSRLRDEIRANLSGDKHAQAVGRMLQLAEEDLTRGIEEALPDDTAQLLRHADRQYGPFKVIEDAVVKAKDPVTGRGAFTPERLETSVQQDMVTRGQKAQYARGGGDRLRDLAADATYAFQNVPQTGLGANLAGGKIGFFTAPLNVLANNPRVQPFFLGEAPSQQSVARAADVLSQYLNLPPYYAAAQSAIGAMRNQRQEQ